MAFIGLVIAFAGWRASRDVLVGLGLEEEEENDAFLHKAYLALRSEPVPPDTPATKARGLLRPARNQALLTGGFDPLQMQKYTAAERAVHGEEDLDSAASLVQTMYTSKTKNAPVDVPYMLRRAVHNTNQRCRSASV